MTWSWIGVDEAGYGARLGPMVVSASWWQIDSAEWNPESLRDADFLQKIDGWSWQSQFAAKLEGPADRSPPHLVADSKKVYQSGQGLDKLARIVTSLLHAIEQAKTPSPPGTRTKRADLNELSDHGTDERPTDASEPHAAWLSASEAYAGHARRVQPHDADSWPYWLTASCREGSAPSRANDPADLSSLANAWASTTVRPSGLFSALISEHEFNQGLIQRGNKAHLLSATSLLLANHVLQLCPAGQTVVIDFDRHGGRKRYLPLLVEHFAADWPQVLGETERESSYLWEAGDRRVFFRFTVDGEQRYPVAAASLASKYARELGMHCVNTFWQRLIPNLPASAGYPVDAARMLAEMQSAIQPLPVPLAELWRNA
jgi:ribonuclease HII